MSRNANIGEQPVYNREVAPRERRVSRNGSASMSAAASRVAPRERRVSRNMIALFRLWRPFVAPRERRVSRNF